MNILLIAAVLILFLIVLYLLCLRPNTGRQHRLEPFENTYIAHRGYFSNADGIPENSLIAFEQAVRHGYGIELDIQLTKDRQLVVFHDASLKRMCGIDKKITDCSFEELQSYKLVKTNYSIPLFTDVLAAINGKVPLVIEIKPERHYKHTVHMLAKLLEAYHGTYCIESFHPGILAWFRRQHPEVIRGQLSTDYRKNKMKADPITGFVLTRLLLNWYSGPDFIAYNYKYANQPSYRLCRRLYPVVNAAWTIRSQKELEQARDIFTIFIFDSFMP